MIQAMAEDKDDGRETQVVTIKGHSVVIRELTDMQLMHLARYARIVSKDTVAVTEKLDAVERLHNILQHLFVQPADRKIVEELEEAGEYTLQEKMGLLSAFKDNEGETEPKPAVTRGRRTARR